MAKYTVDLDHGETRVVLNGLTVSLAQAQRAAKAARTDAVRSAFDQECAAVNAVISKMTKTFAV